MVGSFHEVGGWAGASGSEGGGAEVGLDIVYTV
jgi:hypothetical protein